MKSKNKHSSKPSSPRSSKNSKPLPAKPADKLFTNPVYFYLVKTTHPIDVQKDYQTILTYLGTYGDIGLKKESDTSTTITYSETPVTSYLKTAPPDRLVLTCERIDNASVNILRNVVSRLNYRIYNPKTGSFLVNDPNLIDLTTVQLDPLYSHIFSRYHLTPLFQYQNSQVFYAKNGLNGTIHLVNRHLLEHLLERPSDSTLNQDFSVPVAQNINKFVALFDRGLIPISFYETLNSPDTILNLSGFNLNALDMDIFIAPIFFDLDEPMQTFKMSSSPASQTRKDQLAKGKSIKAYISNLLANQPSSTLLATKIAKDVAYDPVSPGQIIPRLNLSLYIAPPTVT